MKILYVTTIGSTMSFFKSLIEQLIKEGNVVDVATNENIRKVPDCYREWGCKIHQISCIRTPFNLETLKCIREIRDIVKKGEYDVVHCHTPIAAMCARLACRPLRKHGLKVFYTAHGFHFYKGAPLKNWITYYPVEKICAYFTDVLITINQEDYGLAQRKMKAKKVEYVPGVGVDLDRFTNVSVDKVTKRKELGIPENAILLLSVGEVNSNKNHRVIIEAIAKINASNIYFCVAGRGEMESSLQELSEKLGLQNRVKILGYRTDINELCKAADIFCFPSKREGLGLAAIEAMASSLPLITSNVHGINDYSINEVTGYKCDPNDIDGFRNAIEKLAISEGARREIGNNNRECALKYDVLKIIEIMKKIYEFHSRQLHE